MNRLLAQDIIKINSKHCNNITLTSKLLAYQSQSNIKIKLLNKQAKDIQIPVHGAIVKFRLSQHSPWLYLLTSYHLLEIYHIQYLHGINDGNFRKIAIIRNVMEFNETKSGLTISSLNQVLKHITFQEIITKTKININFDSFELKSITKLLKNDEILTSIDSDKIILIKIDKSNKKEQTNQQKTIQIYDKIYRSNRYQKIIAFSSFNIIGNLYKQRYLFQRNGNYQIQIIDIEELSVVGKFQVKGHIKYAHIEDNIFMIVAEQEHTDIIHLLQLKTESIPSQPIITHKICYQRGKSDEYNYYNNIYDKSSQQKRKNQSSLDNNKTNQLSQKSNLMLYALIRQKEKIQIIKINHLSMLACPFSQQNISRPLYPMKDIQQNIQNLSQSLILQKQKINSLIQLKSQSEIKDQKETQAKIIMSFLDIKIKNVLLRFQQFQTRIQRLQKMIINMNKKIQLNIEKINREQIKEKIQKLFDSLTPQFQKYFSDIFKQFTGVIEQGVHYYNLKLAKQAQMHKEILTQIVSQTFKATQDITQISRKQQKISEKTEQTLRKLLQTKRKWTKVQSNEKIAKIQAEKLKISQANDNKQTNKGSNPNNPNYNPHSKRL